MKLKQWIKKLIKKGIDFIKWVWGECRNWQTVLLFLCVMALISFPIWTGYILFFVFHWNWAFWVASVMWAFWLGPFSPFMILCLTITLALKKWGRRVLNKGEEIHEKNKKKIKAKKEKIKKHIREHSHKNEESDENTTV